MGGLSSIRPRAGPTSKPPAARIRPAGSSALLIKVSNDAIPGLGIDCPDLRAGPSVDCTATAAVNQARVSWGDGDVVRPRAILGLEPVQPVQPVRSAQAAAGLCW